MQSLGSFVVLEVADDVAAATKIIYPDKYVVPKSYVDLNYRRIPLELCQALAQEANDGTGRYRVVQPEDIDSVLARYGWKREGR